VKIFITEGIMMREFSMDYLKIPLFNFFCCLNFFMGPDKDSLTLNILKKVFENPLGKIGIIIILFNCVIALMADFLVPFDPYEQKIEQALAGPSQTHWLGQDDLGRDVLSRIIFGTRISLKVGFVTVLVSSLTGMVIGAVAGYYGGWLDEILMRLTDILLAFPGILLAIGIMAILGPSLNNVIIALCIVGWKSYARLIRGEILKEKNKEYIQAARALGYSRFRIIVFHLLPNTMNPLLVMGALGMASMIISEAGLSFLGLGTQPPVPSWGGMLADGRQYLLQAYHLTTFPGVAIMILVLGFIFLGDALRDALDPHVRFMKEL
jgi:peptide/nickel transport system permease protein